MPSSPAVTWLAPLGCTLALVAALALSACGGDGAASAENVPATQSETAAKSPAPASGRACPAKAEALVDALERLRHQLAVGLSYEQYAARVEGLRSSYDAIPVDQLSLGCLRTAATPAERTVNKYIDAANAWGECLADAACTSAAIEPVLQRKWRVASRFLAEAR